MISKSKCGRIVVLIMLIVMCISLCGCDYYTGNTKNDDETEIVSGELLKISDKDGLYATVEEVGAGRTFRVYMNIENVGNNEVKLFVGKSLGFEKDDHDNVFIQNGTSILYSYNKLLYDVVDNVEVYPWKYELYETYSGSEVYYDLAVIPPQNNVGFKWTIQAPEEEDFTQIMSEGVFKFHLEYMAHAKTYREITFQNSVEASQQRFMDTEIKVHENNIAAPGPVVIDFKVPEGEPIEVDMPNAAAESFDITLFFKNVGEGMVRMKGSDILLKVPNGISVGTDCDFKPFDPVLVEDGKKVYKANIDEIEFYGDQGDVVLYCSFVKPDVDFVDVYQFSVEADYVYVSEPEEVSVIVKKKVVNR